MSSTSRSYDSCLSRVTRLVIGSRNFSMFLYRLEINSKYLSVLIFLFQEIWDFAQVIIYFDAEASEVIIMKGPLGWKCQGLHIHDTTQPFLFKSAYLSKIGLHPLSSSWVKEYVLMISQSETSFSIFHYLQDFLFVQRFCARQPSLKPYSSWLGETGVIRSRWEDADIWKIWCPRENMVQDKFKVDGAEKGFELS